MVATLLTDQDEPALVPRWVDHLDSQDMHICLARPTFAEGAIVTLEALCGVWAYGSLTRLGRGLYAGAFPEARFCPRCVAAFGHNRDAYDPYHVFQAAAPRRE